MIVKNYYEMELLEIEAAIAAMRRWLWDFQNSERAPRVLFALRVANRAKKLYNDIKTDPFTKQVVDFLCSDNYSKEVNN